MERSVGSGGVLKKKNSSGCLIIKKKGDFGNSGGGSGGVSVGNKEKKRAAHLVGSVSGSSDDNESLEFMRRKVSDKRLHVENNEYRRNNAGVEIGGGERKRSRLDLFEFDEYDEFDGKKMRSGYMEDAFRMAGHSGSGGSSGRNLAVDKRKQASGFDGSGGGRIKGADNSGSRQKGYELDDDESHIPISLLKLKYQDKANQAIRLQGKNGVLKVMVNKKKDADYIAQNKSKNVRIEERRGSGSQGVSIKDSSDRVPLHRDPRPPENSGLNFKKKNVEKEKEVKLEKTKPASTKVHRAKDLEIERTTDVVTKSAPEGQVDSSSRKDVRREVEMKVEMTPNPEIATPAKQKGVKEGKPKHGGSTEKQMLREQIREMLVGAGWTIDYRPRRNRDYLDAVYINTSGTAYWSIIKAYEAFKKQSEEDGAKSKPDVSSSSPASLPDSLIHKLTRRTKKKIEEETKRKKKEAFLAKSTKKSDVRELSESSDSDRNLKRQQDHKSPRRDLDEGDGESDDHQPKRKVRKVKMSPVSDYTMVQGRTSKISGRCTLLVRGSDKGKEMESDGYVPYTGKRTVLGWLIDSGAAQLSEKLQYMNRKRTRVMLEGWITREGIHCGCCSKILTVSKFELHAGSKLRQPFQNIFLESGASLLQCQIDAWNKQDEPIRKDFHSVDVDGDDPDDDTCGICGDGGDLICCDSCPSTFHQTCLEIQMLPSGDWHCMNCTCKFCGDAGSTSEENENPLKQLVKCSVCESKFHISCSDEVPALPRTSNGASFCGPKCQELYDHLQKILGVKHELEAGFSWSLIQRTDVSDTSHRLHNQRVECNSKLAVALSVMDECFMPIFDRRSGINMIHNIVYNCGSNFNRLNYRGFYTAILERGDEIIAAACIRIHGTRLAEMPFIGTREIYRRQGMCRRLLCAIEAELCSLKIGHLIIPAIPEHMKTWTGVFGFHELENELKKERKSMNMLVFPGTDMLQKPLIKQEASDVAGMKESESSKDQLHLPRKSDIDSPTVHNGQVSSDSGGCHDTTNNEESDAPGSSAAIPAFCSDDNKAGTHTNRESDAPVSSSAVPSFPLDGNKPDTKANHESDAPVSSSAVPSFPLDGNKADTKFNHESDAPASSSVIPVLKTNDEADAPVSSAIPALPSRDDKANTKTNGESDTPVLGSSVPVFHSDVIKADTKTDHESDAPVSSAIPALPSGNDKADTKNDGESDAPVSSFAVRGFHSDVIKADNTNTCDESDARASTSKIPAFSSNDSKSVANDESDAPVPGSALPVFHVEADTKTGDESDAPVSSSAFPAVPSDDSRVDNASDAIYESDLSLASKQTIVVNSEFENNTKEPSASLKDDKNSVEAVIGDACKGESPPNSCSMSSGETGDASEAIENQKLSALDNAVIASVPANVDSLVTVSEGTTSELNVDNSSIKSSSGPLSEACAMITVDEVNRENSESSPVQVVNAEALVQLKPELDQPTLPARESKLHSSVEPSLYPDEDRCNATASCTLVNGEVSGTQLSPGSLRTVPGNDMHTSDENEKSVPVSSVSDGECIMAVRARIDDDVKDERVVSGFVNEPVKDELEAPGAVEESPNPADSEKLDVKDEPEVSGSLQESNTLANSEKPDIVKEETGIVPGNDMHTSDENEKSVPVSSVSDGECIMAVRARIDDDVKDERVVSGFVSEPVKDELEASGAVEESPNPADSEKLDVKDEPEVSGSLQESNTLANSEKPDIVKEETGIPANTEIHDGEIKLPSAFDGKVVSPNHTESLHQSETTNESHKDHSSQSAADM